MLRILSTSAREWLKKSADAFISATSFIIFLFLDLLDYVLCIFYGWADDFLERRSPACYCENRGKPGKTGTFERECDVSETLYCRKNVFRELGVLGMRRKSEEDEKEGEFLVPRWSDCRCESCVSCHGKGEGKLHLVVVEPNSASTEDHSRSLAENVVFLHGFLSSSSFWIETVFPNLSETIKTNYRLFTVDLLGFGRSPKPQDCLYTLEDHLRMIEKSVIEPFQLKLKSFHLVGHSMGCRIALALAAKYPAAVKSMTLTALPYFPSSRERASLITLDRLAKRKLWPLLQFGSSVMSWYEHLGRSICFLVCRNHRVWECLLKLVTRKRDLHFMIMDLTRHTHHSAWHTMHNVICGGAKLMDDHLEVLNKSGILVTLVHGDEDQVVPLECSYNIKLKVSSAEVKVITGAGHCTVILGREKDFTNDLEKMWSTSLKSQLKIM